MIYYNSLNTVDCYVHFICYTYNILASFRCLLSYSVTFQVISNMKFWITGIYLEFLEDNEYDKKKLKKVGVYSGKNVVSIVTKMNIAVCNV